MATTEETKVVTIRQAVDADVPALAVMGTRFVRAASYGRHMLVPKEEIELGLRNVLERGGGVAFVAEVDGRIIGAIVGLMTTPWWSPSCPVAAELAWWVEEEHRGGRAGVRLLRTLERWGASRGARFTALSGLVSVGEDRTGSLLARLGYEQAEVAWVKRC